MEENKFKKLLTCSLEGKISLIPLAKTNLFRKVLIFFYSLKKKKNCTYNSTVCLFLHEIQISSGKSLIRFNNLVISFEIILIFGFLKGKIKREDGWVGKRSLDRGNMSNWGYRHGINNEILRWEKPKH